MLPYGTVVPLSIPTPPVERLTSMTIRALDSHPMLLVFFVLYGWGLYWVARRT